MPSRLTRTPEAVWQLVGLCRWMVELVERLMKQCIYVGELDMPLSKPVSQGTYDADVDASGKLFAVVRNALVFMLYSLDLHAHPTPASVEQPTGRYRPC